MMAALRGLDLGPRTVLRSALVVLAVAVAAYILYLLRRPISWLVIAAFLAIALAAPVAALSKRMPRGVAIVVVYSGVIAVPIALAALLIPPLVSQAGELANNLPAYADDVTEFVNENETLRGLDEDYDITGKLEEEASELPNRIGNAAETLSDIGVSLVNSIFATLTVLILSIFMIAGGGRWVERFLSSQDVKSATRMRRTFDSIGRAISSYVGGALLQAALAGALAYLVLSILGAPFAGALALVVAFGDLIPLVGAAIASAFVAVVMLFVNFPVGVIIWVIYAIVYQQLENYVIQPQIQRRAVAVEPFVILVAVLFGSTLFGVAGALLAIPAAASIQIAIREWADYRGSGEGQARAAAAGA